MPSILTAHSTAQCTMWVSKVSACPMRMLRIRISWDWDTIRG